MKYIGVKTIIQYMLYNKLKYFIYKVKCNNFFPQSTYLCCNYALYNKQVHELEMKCTTSQQQSDIENKKLGNG